MSTAKIGEGRLRQGALIAEVGARGPLGLNSLQVTTAARARKLEPRGSALRDKREYPVGVARSRFLPDDLFGLERLVRLGAPALREAGRLLLAEAPLLVGIAEGDRPDIDAESEAEIVPRLAAASEIAIDGPRSRVIRAGNASFAVALEAALDLLEEGCPAVLVGGVDSFMHPAAIKWLDAAHRLHAPRTDDGIIPSEAAAFALLIPGGAPDPRALRLPAPAPIGRVRFARAARDESALDPDGPVLAETITSLVRGALAAIGAPPGWLVTDVNEQHRAREWSRVEQRCHPAFARATSERAPDLFGDVGAATGALAAAYACRGFSLGGAPRGAMLAALHADGPSRGVFALTDASASEERPSALTPREAR